MKLLKRPQSALGSTFAQLWPKVHDKCKTSRSRKPKNCGRVEGKIRMTVSNPYASLLVLAFATSPALAEMRPTLSFSGGVGLIDMPSGEMLPDATLSFSSAHFGPVTRNTVSFQILPRVSASFRYSGTRNWTDVLPDPPDERPTYFDRSFDLRFKLADEGKLRPAIVVGFNDIIGTGQWSSEYIAATKTFQDRVKVTAGLGWGRLASHGAIGGFGERPVIDFGMGGTLRFGEWFRGDIAPFAGVEWKVSDKLGLKAEYSSDAYDIESDLRKTFDRKSPFNFGVEYQLSKVTRIGASYMYGSQLGISAHFLLNPRQSPTGGQLGDPPPQVQARPPRGQAVDSWSGAWVSDQASVQALPGTVATALSRQGIKLESLTPRAKSVEVRIRLARNENGAQAIGRTARVLTAVMPASVEQFEIVPLINGLPLSKTIIARSDMETLEHVGGQDALILQRSQIVTAGAAAADAVRLPGIYPKLTYGFSPYFRTSIFDPDSPFRADLGVRFSAKYEMAPGLTLSGSVTKKFIGNLDQSTRDSDSDLPRVRSESNLYDKFGDPALETLTLSWHAKPGKNIYTRVTAGYLERMFGGVSAEVLWKPVDSRLALGAEVNYVKQRDFDQGFGFTTYSVLTGHVSGYYSFNNGFSAQLDVGRYLAGDLGATLTVDREFANGWRVGAFATLTDVSFDDFGEGSFDKGIRLRIPLSWASGRATAKAVEPVLRPILRDGGARLEVQDRLYDQVRSKDAVRLNDQWGRFWR